MPFFGVLGDQKTLKNVFFETLCINFKSYLLSSLVMDLWISRFSRRLAELCMFSLDNNIDICNGCVHEIENSKSDDCCEQKNYYCS